MTDRLSVPTNARWRKASYSDNGAGCVELAVLHEATAVRDSKHPTGPTLAFSAPAFRVFLDRIR